MELYACEPVHVCMYVCVYVCTHIFNSDLYANKQYSQLAPRPPSVHEWHAWRGATCLYCLHKCHVCVNVCVNVCIHLCVPCMCECMYSLMYSSSAAFAYMCYFSSWWRDGECVQGVRYCVCAYRQVHQIQKYPSYVHTKIPLVGQGARSQGKLSCGFVAQACWCLQQDVSENQKRNKEIFEACPRYLKHVLSHGPQSWSSVMVLSHGPQSWSSVMVLSHGPHHGKLAANICPIENFVLMTICAHHHCLRSWPFLEKQTFATGFRSWSWRLWLWCMWLVFWACK